MRGWQAPLTNAELRVLHIYRRVPPPPQTSGSVAFVMRWRRICDEVIDEIARTASPSEGDSPAAVAAVFQRLARCVETGHLDGSLPSFTAYKLTEQGNALLDRWKKAGHP